MLIMRKGSKYHHYTNGKINRIVYLDQEENFKKSHPDYYLGYTIDMAGPKNPMYGKKHSKETKHLISKAKSGKKLPPGCHSGEKGPMYGKKQSQKFKDAMQLFLRSDRNPSKSPERIQKMRKDNPMFDPEIRKRNSDAQVRHLQLMDQPFTSKSERYISSYLEKLFPLIRQFKIKGFNHQYDMMITLPDNRQLIIEFDGHRYHDLSLKLENDPRYKYAIKNGYLFLRITDIDYHNNKGIAFVRSQIAKFYPGIVNMHTSSC
jgi:hypothetical protein